MPVMSTDWPGCRSALVRIMLYAVSDASPKAEACTGSAPSAIAASCSTGAVKNSACVPGVVCSPIRS